MMIIRLGCLAKGYASEPLHPEKRLVHEADGGTHFQTFHVKDKRKPPKTENQKKADPQGPGAELTLMSIMKKFSTEEAARAYFEKIRWPNGPVCPYCGSRAHADIPENKARRVRPGLRRCQSCGDKYTATVGTAIESTHIPLNKWLIAFYMMCASKTQVSALQLQRELELGSYQTALFMCHRVRLTLADIMPEKFKGTVEVDETYVGGKAKGKGRGYIDNKTPVVSAVERGGRVHSEVVQGKVTGKVIKQFLDEHVDKTAHLNTDEAKVYIKPGKQYASHDTVNHKADEYVRRDKATGRLATTNAAEGYFGNTKNSIRGTHHGVGPQHLDLYMGELDYKYNTRHITDGERTVAGMAKVGGKRMTRRQMFDKAKERGIDPQLRLFTKAVEPENRQPEQDEEMKMPESEFDDIMRQIFQAKPKRKK